MSDKKVEPRILKGFRDYLPKEAKNRNRLLKIITNLFEIHGFSAIDTPALEYSEILVGKGSEETDKQMFRFKDQGDRDVSLRFDLTVPLARFVSQYQNDLVFPFKRFHIAPVWRAEKPQKGRYREFLQCDFDIIGSSSYLADLEVINLVHSFFTKINTGYKVRINHRGILNSIINQYSEIDKAAKVLRVIDKLDKIGSSKVINELVEENLLDEKKSTDLVNFLEEVKNITSNNDRLKLIENKIKGSDLLTNSISNIKKILASLGSYQEQTILDISIARGLDYYTGVVFETQLEGAESIGSVCSGGRYDNLTSKFTSRNLQGVGGSIGLDRLIAGLQEISSHLNKDIREGVFIAVLGEEDLSYGSELAREIRNKNIICEVCSDITKVGNQFKYADNNLRKYIVVIGGEERASGNLKLKDLSITEKEKATVEVKRDKIVDLLCEKLSV